MNKILVASFIFPERLDWFLNYLETKFNINKDKVFIFKNLDDESKLIVTFKFKVKKKVNLKLLFPNAIPIHKRGMAIYTINALNKLIQNEVGEDIHNIDVKKYKIDWDLYQGKLILNSKNVLTIYNIERIFT